MAAFLFFYYYYQINTELRDEHEIFFPPLDLKSYSDFIRKTEMFRNKVISGLTALKSCVQVQVFSLAREVHGVS